MQSVRLKNKALIKDLEIACKKNGGILTYAEYLSIEQFGNHGYHAQHKEFGRTGTHHHWPTAILTLCKNNNFKHVVEFGSGDATLGIALAKTAEKENFPLLWHGIEINKNLRKQTIHGFKKYGLEKYLGNIISSFPELAVKEPSLVIFSYSLDSIPPEIFINTKQHSDVPDTIIGIRAEKDKLTEYFLSESQLKQKGIVIKNGIISTKSMTYDLRSWKLFPWQRAYIPLAAFGLFQDAVTYFKNKSTFLIMDEFRPAPFSWEVNHRCLPKSLYKKQREENNISTYYKRAGEHLLYYPFYLHTWISILHALGLTTISFDIEQKMARSLVHAMWMPFHKTYFTYAMLATKTEKNISENVVVPYPGRTIL